MSKRPSEPGHALPALPDIPDEEFWSLPPEKIEALLAPYQQLVGAVLRQDAAKEAALAKELEARHNIPGRIARGRLRGLRNALYRLYRCADGRYIAVGALERRFFEALWVGLGLPDFDDEERVLITEFPAFALYNIYFPNGRSSPARLAYKLAFYEAFQRHVAARAQHRRCLIVCGDVNTAHQDLDIAHPQRHRQESGFLPEERAWLDRFLADGWVDTFRHFHPQEPGAYTWWNPRARARERNVGWRLDYSFVPERCLGQVIDAGISPDIPGSDHCPIWLDVRFTP